MSNLTDEAQAVKPAPCGCPEPEGLQPALAPATARDLIVDQIVSLEGRAYQLRHLLDALPIRLPEHAEAGLISLIRGVR